jgi:hypothetical protein
MKTATVKKVQGNGDFNGFYCFEVDLDNGESGQMWGKKPECFVNPGDVVKYEMSKTKSGHDKINVSEKVKGAAQVHDQTREKSVEIQAKRLDFDQDKQVLIIRQSSLKAAIEWRPSAEIENVLKAADIFTNYCLTGEHPKVENPDDLPF